MKLDSFFTINREYYSTVILYTDVYFMYSYAHNGMMESKIVQLINAVNLFSQGKTVELISKTKLKVVLVCSLVYFMLLTYEIFHFLDDSMANHV